METVTIPKELFSKILSDVDILMQDVEKALYTKVKNRINEIETKNIDGKTEKDLDDYLRKRGIKFE